MRWFAVSLTALAAVAIVAVVFVAFLTGGARVTVISVNDVGQETFKEIKEIIPIEDGVYCDFQECCLGHKGIDKLDLSTGDVICSDGSVSETCTCKRQELFRLR